MKAPNTGDFFLGIEHQIGVDRLLRTMFDKRAKFGYPETALVDTVAICSARSSCLGTVRRLVRGPGQQ